MRRCRAWCGTWWPRWFAVADAELALIALGANLADPPAAVRAAATRLAELGELAARSSIYRTDPVGGPSGQPPYLNAVVALRPSSGLVTCSELLAQLHRIEVEFGRVRRVRWEARVLDLDLLAFGDRVEEVPGLTVPHPRILERPFVLVPLVEVAPSWRHPRSGERAADALARLDASGVRRSGVSWIPR